MNGLLTPYTVTLNPAVDRHIVMKTLAVGRESVADSDAGFAGGKGINVSAALDAFGVENSCLFLLGEESAASFLTFPGLPRRIEYITVPGRVRENITLHTREGETRISLRGEAVSEEAVKALLSKIPAGRRPVAFCGSLPPGISSDFIVEQLLLLKEKGALLFCDSSALDAGALERLHPFFIKPNEWELAALCGEGVSRAAAARSLCTKACHVFVTCGGGKGVWVWEGGERVLIPPTVTPVSTVGAGDSTLAGFMAGLCLGYEPEECARLGLAFGSAACLVPGTAPPVRKDIDELYEKTSVEPAQETDMGG